MKAKELMLGDWVYDSILKGNTKVMVLFANSIRGDYHERDYPISQFESIPLTKEILQKNGFLPQGTGWTLENEEGDRLLNLITIPNGFGLLTAGVTIHLTSVHELQHLFALCGIKKEITL